MTPIDTEPVNTVGPMGSGRRPQKPSGGAQAIMMILAWVGGAAAAVAVAFWILQFVKPSPDPNPVVVKKRPANLKKDDPKSRPAQPVKRKVVKPRQTPAHVAPKPAKELVDLQNFERPKMPGLKYGYYEGESFGMVSFGAATPSRSGTVVDIEDLPDAGTANGLRLEGYWETKTQQPCDFLLDSTNGARVSIDGILVLDNTAQFERKAVKESRNIEPGVHSVQIDFVLSNERGSYKLEVGGAGAPQRMNLVRLLQPLGLDEPKSVDSLEYALGKHGEPVLAAKALMARSRKAVESGFVETVSATPSGDDKSAKTIMPEGVQLLAGLAISSQDGQVGAVMPIYLGDSGLSLGETIGQKSADWEAVIAKPGFAVSALQIRQSDRAEDVSLEFRMIGQKSLVALGAYAQSPGREPVAVTVEDSCLPVVGLRVHIASDLRLLGVDALRVRSGDVGLYTILVNGFPKPSGLKKAPSPNEAKKGMKKMMRESASRMEGKTESTRQMELRALAESTAETARNAVSNEAQFVGLLEARRLLLLAGEVKSAFAVMEELSQKFDYDYWTDALLFFNDAAKMANESKSRRRKVLAELGPVIFKAEDSFEFEAAGKLAAGGKMLAAEVKDQTLFGQFNRQLDQYERSAEATKQARVAAKTLIRDPDDGKANRAMGIFSLVVTQDSDKAMDYFARSANKDCEFIAEHDQDFNGNNAEIAMELADCWKRLGKKSDLLEQLAATRFKEILTQAKRQAQGKALKAIEADLERL